MIDGIFGQDGQFIGLNHLRNAVVDFRVHMIGTAHEHNRLLSGALNMLQNLFAIIAHIFTVTGNFHISCFHCPGDFLLADVFPLAEFLVKAGRQALFIVYGHKGLNEFHFLLAQNIHIPTDIFCIGRHNRTVEVIVRIMHFVLHVVRRAGIENLLDALFHQVHDMTMGNLGRIAKGIRRHRSHALIVHLRTGLARQFHPIT